MNKRLAVIGVLISVLLGMWSCKDDVSSAGEAVLDKGDAIIVLADTFSIRSGIDSCSAIISQADSFLLGEIETDYGLLRASILTQLACPEGYSYPANAEIDSMCLFIYYGSWVGDGSSPMAVNAYMMDKGTFTYSHKYPTDLNIDDYCSREMTVLANHRIVAAAEKLDSVLDANGDYIPMLRMRLNNDFVSKFWSIKSFETQEKFNQQFNGLLIESSFGSSTVLNISNIALGVFYHFSYSKAGRDTTVNDMKAFYANAEVRTVNHLAYRDKAEWIEALQKDSDTYNYIIAPAGVYTRIRLPMAEMADTIMQHMEVPLGEEEKLIKRPYVNMAQIRVDVENVYDGSDADKKRNDWLQPAKYMLLIKEESMDRFFSNKELPSDTCALLGALTQSVDSLGDAVYYYSYDLSVFLTNQLRKENAYDELKMLLVPVNVSTATTTSGTTGVSAVRQQQTLSATKIRSAKSGMKFKIVYSGF